MASKMNLGSWGWKVAFPLALYLLVSSVVSLYPSLHPHTHVFAEALGRKTEQWNLCPSKVRHCMPVVPATQEAKAWKSLEFRSWVQCGQHRDFPPNTLASKHIPMHQTLALSVWTCQVPGSQNSVTPHLDHLSVLQFPRFYISLLMFGL
jgi:hypothetical protein